MYLQNMYIQYQSEYIYSAGQRIGTKVKYQKYYYIQEVSKNYTIVLLKY